MSVLDILKIIVAIATILTGLYSLVRPQAIRGFTGLVADGPRGITEIRAVMGGVFIGLGIAALWFRDPKTYSMLAVAYLAIAIIRAISMFFDKSVESSNIISLAAEIIFIIILFL